MKAKKKPIAERQPADYGIVVEQRLEIVRLEEPAGRAAGIKVGSAAELVERLRSEAGVL
ncbi:Electron transfer flavoprotein subunit beta [compost metagenome]